MSGGFEPSLADVMSQLDDAMRAVGGTTSDPDLRRAAARLADLVRSEDNELERFGRRHFPQRPTDTTRLSELRDLVLALARLLAVFDSPDAASLIAATRATLVPRLEELEAAERERVESPSAPPDESERLAVQFEALTREPTHTPWARRDESEERQPQFEEREPTPTPWARRDEREDRQSRFDDPEPTHTPWALHDEPEDEEGWLDDPGTTSRIRLADMPGVMRAPFPLPPPSEARPNASSHPHDIRVLPFRDHHDAPPPSQAPPPEHEESFPDEDTLDTTDRATLPGHLAALDIAAHASFTAMLTVFPDHREQIYAQFGIGDDAERERLDHHWHTTCQADHALATQWTELHDRAITHYRTPT